MQLVAGKKKSTSTPISADVKKYFSFNKGSYWIYKDPVSGEVDSFVIQDHATKSVLVGNGQSNTEEINYIYKLYPGNIFQLSARGH